MINVKGLYCVDGMRSSSVLTGRAILNTPEISSIPGVEATNYIIQPTLLNILKVCTQGYANEATVSLSYRYSSPSLKQKT